MSPRPDLRPRHSVGVAPVLDRAAPSPRGLGLAGVLSALSRLSTERTFFILASAAVVLLLNAYPLYQAAMTGGYVFYQNGFDEPAYLQYDHSIEVLHLSRGTQLGQYLVLLLQQAGLPGGWVNLVLDVGVVVAFLSLITVVFRLAGLKGGRAYLLSLLTTILPVLFVIPNPVTVEAFNNNLSSGLVYWINMPSATNFLSLVRSPEPQTSMVLVALALVVALKLKSYLPLYVSMPFLYPFIAIPLLFVTLALHLSGVSRRLAKHPAVPPVLSYVVVSCMLAVYFGFVVNPGMKEAMAATRLPLFSVTGFLGLALFAALRGAIKPEHRYLAFLVALAPLAVSNQQILSGWIAQPYNFEVYAGIYCLGLVVVLAVSRFRVVALALVAVSLAGVAYETTNSYGAFQYTFNLNTNRQLVWNEQLLTALRTDSPHVAINDINLASIANMALARQPATAFAFQRTIGTSMVDKNFADYLCARRELSKDAKTAQEFAPVFAVLDKAYRYQGLDYPLLHLGRKSSFEVKHDPDLEPRECTPATFLVATTTGRREQVEAKGYRLYSSTSGLAITRGMLQLAPASGNLETPFRARIAEVGSSGVVVKGQTPPDDSRLVQWAPSQHAKGARFVARGEIRQGGFRLGLIDKDGQWAAAVDAVTPGEFTAVIEVPADGLYGLALTTAGAASMRSDFTFTQFGWGP